MRAGDYPRSGKAGWEGMLTVTNGEVHVLPNFCRGRKELVAGSRKGKHERHDQAAGHFRRLTGMKRIWRWMDGFQRCQRIARRGRISASKLTRWLRVTRARKETHGRGKLMWIGEWRSVLAPFILPRKAIV